MAVRVNVLAPLLLVAWAIAPLVAAPPHPQQDRIAPSFRAGVDLVALTVTVTDPRQNIISTLTEHDFKVIEDGVDQSVMFFSRERVPLDLALLIDTSGSMASALPTAQEAAAGLVRTTAAGDRVMVVTIHDRVEMVSPLSSDVEAAMSAIGRTRPRGNTALYTGLYVALTEMVKCRNGPEVRRQAIAVLSDGKDTASLVAYDDVMALLREAGITVYTISLTSSSDQVAWGPRPILMSPPSGLFVMRSFATETGGRPFVTKTASELPAVYRGIAAELAQQYVIGYVSTNARRDDGYRRVEVRLLDQPGLTARTRAGYQPPRQRP